MGYLKFDVPNTLPVEEAKKRVEALLAYWKRKYGVSSTWSGVSATMQGKAMGVSIDGKLTVEAARIAGEAVDPGMLLRGQAKKYLERKFAEYLDSTRSLEQLTKNED
jgi:hypothetical protein